MDAYIVISLICGIIVIGFVIHGILALRSAKHSIATIAEPRVALSSFGYTNSLSMHYELTIHENQKDIEIQLNHSPTRHIAFSDVVGVEAIYPDSSAKSAGTTKITWCNTKASGAGPRVCLYLTDGFVYTIDLTSGHSLTASTDTARFIDALYPTLTQILAKRDSESQKHDQQTGTEVTNTQKSDKTVDLTPKSDFTTDLTPESDKTTSLAQKSDKTTSLTLESEKTANITRENKQPAKHIPIQAKPAVSQTPPIRVCVTKDLAEKTSSDSDEVGKPKSDITCLQPVQDLNACGAVNDTRILLSRLAYVLHQISEGLNIATEPLVADDEEDDALYEEGYQLDSDTTRMPKQAKVKPYVDWKQPVLKQTAKRAAYYKTYPLIQADCMRAPSYVRYVDDQCSQSDEITDFDVIYQNAPKLYALPLIDTYPILDHYKLTRLPAWIRVVRYLSFFYFSVRSIRSSVRLELFGTSPKPGVAAFQVPPYVYRLLNLIPDGDYVAYHTDAFVFKQLYHYAPDAFYGPAAQTFASEPDDNKQYIEPRLFIPLMSDAASSEMLAEADRILKQADKEVSTFDEVKSKAKEVDRQKANSTPSDSTVRTIKDKLNQDDNTPVVIDVKRAAKTEIAFDTANENGNGNASFAGRLSNLQRNVLLAMLSEDRGSITRLCTDNMVFPDVVYEEINEISADVIGDILIDTNTGKIIDEYRTLVMEIVGTCQE